MLKEVFVVLCLMLAFVAAYPENAAKSDEPVEVESADLGNSEEQDLSGAESRYGWGGGWGGRGFGHYGGWGGGHGGFYGRGYGFGGFGHRGFGGHRYWG